MKITRFLFVILLGLFYCGEGAFAASEGTTSASVVNKEHVSTDKININQANIATLSNSIKGIGPKRAANIVAYREQHGAFKSLEDLAKVKGVGTKFIARHHEELSEKFSF